MSVFPDHHYEDVPHFAADYGGELDRAWKNIDQIALSCVAAELYGAYTRGARVFTCGNGGSASIANHLACDHVKGISNRTILRPQVFSLTANVELLTAVANDISYDDIFRYQLGRHAARGDVLLTISSSGQSRNIVKALDFAQAVPMRTIAFTGFKGGQARDTAEFNIHVDSDNYGIVEDIHQAVMHMIAQYIRQYQMNDETIRDTVF